MQAYFAFVIFAIVLATVVNTNAHAVHLLRAVRPRPEYPQDVGMFKDKFHSIDAVRPGDSYPLNERLLRDSLHAQHINPDLSDIHNGMRIAHNPLFMKDKKSELKKKKREQKKAKGKAKAKGGDNKGSDDKESEGVTETGGGGKKGKKN